MRQALVFCGLGCLFLTAVFAVHHDAIPDSLSDDEEREFNRMEGRSMESLLHWGIGEAGKAVRQRLHAPGYRQSWTARHLSARLQMACKCQRLG